MQGFCFDYSCKHKTLLSSDKTWWYVHQQTLWEEHRSIDSKAKSTYVVTSSSGKAKDIALEILSLINKKSVDTNQLVAVGWYSKTVHSSIKGGCSLIIEESI